MALTENDPFIQAISARTQQDCPEMAFPLVTEFAEKHKLTPEQTVELGATVAVIMYKTVQITGELAKDVVMETIRSAK